MAIADTVLTICCAFNALWLGYSCRTTHSSVLLRSSSRPWFGSCIMYDMIGVFVAASSGIMALNFFLCGRSQGPQCVSLIYWLSVPQTKVLLGIQDGVCDCVQRGETHGPKDRLVRAEISFKVVLLNLAYITGILTHDMCGSSSGACHRKVCSKCRNLSHRI